MERISVTELDEWQKCPHSFYLKGQGWRKRAAPPPDPLAVGSMVGLAVEARLTLGKQHVAQALRTYQEKYDLVDRSDLHEQVMTCLDVMPEWVWEIQGAVTEDHIEHRYATHWTGDFPHIVEVVGRPDIWYVDEWGIHIVELKTCNVAYSGTARKLNDYAKYGAQPSRYAVLIRDAYPELDQLAIDRRHVVVSRKGFAAASLPFELSDRAVDNARSDMLELARQAVTSAPVHSFGPLCGWCEFSPVCEGYVNGQDTVGILKEHFEQRKRRA